MAQTVLITGASSGLGAEMARQLAGRGHDLALAHVVPTGSTRCARRSRTGYPDARVEVRALDVDDHDAVFEVFRGFATDFGRIDRVVVNAGIGKGAPLGTGRFDANRQTATTNFVAALAQTEAALEIFRAQGTGHLVMVSSMSAMRGMPKAGTTYAATKAGVAHLAEGVRAEMLGSPIHVSVLYPGYIRSEMNDHARKPPPFMVGTERGVAAMVEAMEKQKPSARVPPWPWVPLGFALKHLPLPLARRFMG